MVESSHYPNFESKLDHIEETLLTRLSKDKDQQKDLKHKLSIVKQKFTSRWRAAYKKKEAFEKNNSDWLNGMTSLQYTGSLNVLLSYLLTLI